MKTLLFSLKIRRSFAILVAVSSLSLMFQNCAKARFSQSADSSGVGGYGIDPAYNNINIPHTEPNSCYTYLHQTNGDIRLLFIVDQSGSNAGSGGTDPQKAVRGGSIQAFFDDYKSKPAFHWGFTAFAGNAANPYIMNSVNQPYFSAQIADMQAAINMFQNVQDGGNTPYQAALDSAIQSIQNDTAYSASAKYIVVFLSDGMPNPDVSDSVLRQDVLNILSIHPGQVSFNTVYYGPGDQVASERLHKMATAGNGYFLDTNRSANAKDFLISNVIQVPGTTCTP